MAPGPRGSWIERALARRWHVAGFACAVAVGALGVSRLTVGVVLDRAGAAAHGLGEALASSSDARPPRVDRERRATIRERDDDRERVEGPPHERRAHPPTARVGRTAGDVAKPRGLLIRERAVLAAIARGARPSGQVVPATADSPGGLRLSGVPAPFREGDVLIAVGGTPARSEDAIVNAVLGAVKSGARTITGEILRRAPGDAGVERIPFAVEVPERFWKARALPRK